MSPSVIPTQDAWNRTAAVVRAVERSPRILSRPNRRATPSAPIDWTGVTNADAEAIPAEGACLWMYEYLEASNTWRAKRPTYAGITRIGVATSGGTAKGATTFAFTSGVHPVLVEDYANVDLLTRVTPYADSWYARPFKVGPILIVGTVAAADQPSGLASGCGLMLGELDGFRPDPFLWVDENGVEQHVYAIRVAGGLTLTSLGDGVYELAGSAEA